MTEAQYKLAKDQEREKAVKAVKADKKRIDQALSSNDETTLRATHMDIDGKYGAYIPDWGKSMYAYGEDLGFNYEWLNKDSLIHNLTLMKSRLEGYALGLEKPTPKGYSPNNSVNVNVSNTNEVNVSISFEDIRKQIEDMTSLTEAQTKEALDKVSEIESVVNGTDSKKQSGRKLSRFSLGWQIRVLM